MDLWKKPRWLLLVIGIAIGLVLIGGAWFCVKRFYPPRRDGVYAVFLTNNQVYFGHIDRDTRKTLVLTNIYYIQYKDQAQAGASTDISLLKLGNEVHGPEDHMEINRDHVLFIEKLKPDGRVAKAIADYKPEK